MKTRLGSFEETINIDNMKFLVRGLTVGEYIELMMKGFNKHPESFFKTIALTCILDWDHVYRVSEFSLEEDNLIVEEIERDEEGGIIYVEFSDEELQDLDDSLLFHIGKEIYYKHSIVSKEESDRYIAFARWMYYASEDTPQVKADLENFECENCIKEGYYKDRKCGLSQQEFDLIKYKESKDVEEEKETTSSSKKEIDDLMLKYKLPESMFRKSYKLPEVEEVKEDDDKYIERDYFKYKECPTSLITYQTRVVAEKVYFANKSNIPFMSGGLTEQDNKFMQIAQIVNSECNKIEAEKMKREQNSNKKGSK